MVIRCATVISSACCELQGALPECLPQNLAATRSQLRGSCKSANDRGADPLYVHQGSIVVAHRGPPPFPPVQTIVLLPAVLVTY